MGLPLHNLYGLTVAVLSIYNMPQEWGIGNGKILIFWDRQGTSYPPETDKVSNDEAISRVKEDVGWGTPQPATFRIQIA
jgi:hypothetical protein